MRTKLLLLILLAANSIFINAQMDDKFYFPSKVLQSIEWKNVEALKFPVENDTVSAIILKPNQKAKATIFYFHGAGGNVTTYTPLLTSLLNDQFQIVMIDFRGYGKSTGQPLHTNIAEDGEKIFKELIKRDDIKNKKIIFYGASMGSQIATHLANSHQNEISGLVLEGGIFSFGHIAAVYAPQVKDYLENSFATPYSAKEDIKQITKIPKLIIHSKEDKDVPFAQGIMLFDAASEPKQFIEFSGEHLYALKYESREILESLNKMIAN